MGREPHTHLNIEQRGGVTMHTNKSPGAAPTASGAETNFCTSLGTSNLFSQQGLVASAHARAAAAYELPALFEETFAHDPLWLKERLYRHITPTMADACLVDLARDRLASHRFDFDASGAMAYPTGLAKLRRATGVTA